MATLTRGGYWERHCERGVKKAGFEPVGECAEWRSVYFNKETRVLCIIYVDEFKLAGPEAAVAQAWTDIAIKGGIKITDPERSTQFLGCKHHADRDKATGIAKVTYDMEDFLRECCAKYEDLASGVGQPVSWHTVSTPFIEETDHDDFSKQPITDKEDGYQCPFCQGVYPQSCFT